MLVVDLVGHEAVPEKPRDGPEESPGVGPERAGLDKRGANAPAQVARPVDRLVQPRSISRAAADFATARCEVAVERRGAAPRPWYFTRLGDPYGDRRGAHLADEIGPLHPVVRAIAVRDVDSSSVRLQFSLVDVSRGGRKRTEAARLDLPYPAATRSFGAANPSRVWPADSPGGGRTARRRRSSSSSGRRGARTSMTVRFPEDAEAAIEVQVAEDVEGLGNTRIRTCRLIAARYPVGRTLTPHHARSGAGVPGRAR